MDKIFFVDTYYPDVLAAQRENPDHNYADRMRQLLDLKFGTSDFYSHAFRNYGWEAKDIIPNDYFGRKLWCRENGVAPQYVRESTIFQILNEKPDVVYFQDLSFLKAEELNYIREKVRGILLVGQHSCAWAGNDVVRNYDFLWTSFPHFMDKLKQNAVEHDFLQIGFGGERIFDALGWPDGNRPFDVSFVGGVGAHWSRGNELLERVAQKIDSFTWWGYGNDQLPPCLLKRIWQGQAWGLDMYRVYMRSKIVINRHGEVAQGISNNMRMFEATGCGALMMTEASENLDCYFEDGFECVSYTDESDLIEKIRYYLDHDDERQDIAEAGHQRAMKYHTYQTILERPSKNLRFMMDKKK